MAAAPPPYDRRVSLASNDVAAILDRAADGGRISPEEARAVRELQLPGVYLDREPRRYYPNRSLAGPLLGWAGLDAVGQEGIELQYERWLRGARAQLLLLVAVRRRLAQRGHAPTVPLVRGRRRDALALGSLSRREAVDLHEDHDPALFGPARLRWNVYRDRLSAGSLQWLREAARKRSYPGEVEFEAGGQTLRLTAFNGQTPGSLFILFTDTTSGVTTYPANRSLPVPAPDGDGRVTLDFNRAVNLPCAYTEFATCPLPPAGNRLPVAVEAGEKSPA